MGRIVELPFSYSVRGIPSGARNPRTVEILDIVPVELREVDRSDFRPILAFRQKGLDGRETEMVYGAFEDQLYVFSGYGSSRDLPWVLGNTQRLREAVEGGRETVITSPLDDIMVKRSFADGGMLHERRRIRETSWSNEERERASFLARAEKILLVDGDVLIPVTEPTWSVRHTSTGTEVGLTRGRPAVNQLSFRLDRRDEAIEYAKYAKRAREGAIEGRTSNNPAGNDIKVMDQGLDILGDWPWRFDEVRHGADILRSVIASTWTLQVGPNQSALAHATPELLVAMCGVRDAKDDAALLSAANALETVLEKLPLYDPLSRHLLAPVALWTWARRALPDRRNEPSAEALTDLRM